jgi:hypothetical protein
MGIDINSVIVLLVTNVLTYTLCINLGRAKKLNVMQQGTRVRYRGSKDGKWKFGIIEEDIIGERTLAILRGIELHLDESGQLTVKRSHRIFPIKAENMEILGYDEVWQEKDLV